jgi:hypothetical protein
LYTRARSSTQLPLRATTWISELRPLWKFCKLSALRTLCVAAALVCTLPLSAQSAGAAEPEMNDAAPPQAQKTTADLLSDLSGDNASDRLYAARALRGVLAQAQRAIEHAPAGSLARDDGLATLDELEQRLPDQCMTALQFKNVVALSAEMLALLKYRDALPAVQAAAATETRKGVKRRLDGAVALLSTP